MTVTEPAEGTKPRTRDADINDVGKRAADHINIHLFAHDWSQIRDKWLAISLADGSSDGHIYENASEAARHQRFEQQCWYVCFRGIGPAGAAIREASICIQFWRDAYQAGVRFVDPDDRVRMPLMSTNQHDHQNLRQEHPLAMKGLMNWRDFASPREQDIIDRSGGPPL